jgi:hypothetical protein
MLISVQVKQVLDDEVIIDEILKYNSIEEFHEHLQLAHQNWKSMHGKYCVINTYSDVIAPGRCFYGTTTCSDDFERWEIVEIDMQEKKKPNLIIDVDHVVYSSESDGKKKTYDEYSIIDSNTRHTYARTMDKDIAELILKAIKDKFAT